MEEENKDLINGEIINNENKTDGVKDFDQLFENKTTSVKITPYNPKRIPIYIVAICCEIFMYFLSMIFSLPFVSNPKYYEPDKNSEMAAISLVSKDTNGVTLVSQATFEKFTGLDDFLDYDKESAIASNKVIVIGYYVSSDPFIYYLLSNVERCEELFLHDTQLFIMAYFSGTVSTFLDSVPINMHIALKDIPEDIRDVYSNEYLIDLIGEDCLLPSSMIKLWIPAFINLASYVCILVILIVILLAEIKTDSYSLASGVKGNGLGSLLGKLAAGTGILFGCSMALGVLVNFIQTILKLDSGTSANETAIMRMTESPLSLLMLLPAVCLVGPFVEELIFRKSFFGLIKNPNLALVLSSVCFGLIHVTTEISSRNFLLAFIQSITYVGMGFTLGILYRWNKYNLFVVFIIHALYNSLSMILSLVLLKY